MPATVLGAFCVCPFAANKDRMSANTSDARAQQHLFDIDISDSNLHFSRSEPVVRRTIFTGPIRPDSTRVCGAPKPLVGMLEVSTFLPGGARRSPMIRFVHSFVTL